MRNSTGSSEVEMRMDTEKRTNSKNNLARLFLRYGVNGCMTFVQRKPC